MRDGVDKFLTDSAHVGEFHSSGSFSLEISAARKKLAQSLLPKPEFWILKLLQAAVGFRAATVTVKLLRGRAIVEFSPERPFSGQDFLGAVESQRYSTDGTQSLMAGIYASVGVSSQTLCELVCAGEMWTFTLNSTEVTWQREESDPKRPPSLRVVSVRPFAWSRTVRSILTRDSRLGHAFRQTGLEYAALVRRARSFPIPIRIDGRELKRALLKQGQSVNFREPHTAALGKLEEEGFYLGSVPVVESEQAITQASWRTVLAVRHERTVHPLAFVTFVNRGIVVQKLAIRMNSLSNEESDSAVKSTLAPVLQVVHYVKDSELDVSGFAVRELFVQLESLQKQAVQFLQEVSTQDSAIDQLFQRITELSLSKRKRYDFFGPGYRTGIYAIGAK